MPVIRMNKRRKHAIDSKAEIEEIIIDDDELDNKPAGVDEAIKKEIEKHLNDVKLEKVIDKKADEEEIPSFDADFFDKVLKKELEKHVKNAQKLTSQKLKQYERIVVKETAMLKEANLQLKQVELKLADFEKKNANLEKYVAIAKDTNEKLAAEVKNTEEKMSKKLSDSDSKLCLSEEKLLTSERNLAKTQEKLDQVGNKLKETEDKLEKSQNKLNDFEEKLNNADERVDDTEEKLTETEEKLAVIQEKLNQAEKQIVESAKHIKVRLANKDNLLKNVQAQSEEHRQDLMNKYENKCSELASIEANLKAESDMMAGKIDRFEKLLILKDDAIKAFKVKSDKLSQENKALLEREENFSFTMNNKVKANLDQLKVEHEQLRRDRNEKNIEIDKLKEGKELFEIKCKDMAQTKCDLELALKAKDFEAELFQKKFSSISLEKDALTKTLLKMEVSCEKHMKEILVRKETLETLKVQEAELKSLKEKNEKLERKKLQYKTSERKIEKELISLKKQVYFPKPNSYKIQKIKKEKTIDVKGQENNIGEKSKRVIKEDTKEAYKNTEFVLFVSNIDYTATKKEMEYLFKPFCKKNGFRVKLPKPASEIDSSDLQVHANRGFGFVTFNRREDAEEALKNNLEFHGRKLLVRWNK